ncbi:hypothetical protein ACQPW1_32195 [Nocardia sp. CA-128927]|uniref:hypothetical protein n=1 Tax=Nocardia sp. CA-128927 TaxID=3239975 RepID=UPI003D98257A
MGFENCGQACDFAFDAVEVAGVEVGEERAQALQNIGDELMVRRREFTNPPKQTEWYVPSAWTSHLYRCGRRHLLDG